jgi:hypothetical protein
LTDRFDRGSLISDNARAKDVGDGNGSDDQDDCNDYQQLGQRKAQLSAHGAAPWPEVGPECVFQFELSIGAGSNKEIFQLLAQTKTHSEYRILGYCHTQRLVALELLPWGQNL